MAVSSEKPIEGHGATDKSHTSKTVNDPSIHVIEIEKTPKDFKVPPSMWDLILRGETAEEAKEKREKKDKASHGEKKSEAHGASATSEHSTGSSENDESSVANELSIVVWQPIKVRLIQKSEGVLKYEKIEFSFSRGGGQIDLKDHVKGEKGSFYIQFNLEEFKNLKDLKVLFYSKNRKRKIDGVVFGSGCNVFFDITNKFIEQNSKEGIKVNITDLRHLTVIGGHFIIYAKDQDRVVMTQVEFFDSQKRDYFCPEST